MTHKLPRWLKLLLGIFLILFGVIGHLVPLLPGTMFIVAGVLLLAEAIPAVQRRLVSMELRYPKIHTALARVRLADGTPDLTRIAILLIVISLVFTILGYAVYRFWPML